MNDGIVQHFAQAGLVAGASPGSGGTGGRWGRKGFRSKSHDAYLVDAARGAAEAASRAVAQGLVEIGSGEGPVDVLGVGR